MSAVARIEIDGKLIEVPPGTMLMEAANRLGIYVPHFCYHKKLSIAANCRMCLVEVEKAPKPLPACATPVTDGMKAWTHTAKAKQAQNGVMEFLLINHPLDCPICDQGGECQLQDLAVGYGGSGSRFTEEKRVVPRKDIGPLVAAEEMTRCIQCTRCIRFGQEVAGIMELGMIGRGEHAEIVSFVGRTVDSELSGNMIDICPVGALTSKPFRYSARTWELARRRSIAPHDSLGSNIVVQVKQSRVMRVLPLENEALNECWLSDKDRFSYEALNAPQRLVKPMLREAGGWRAVEWQAALEFVAKRLAALASAHGAEALGALASPHATLEELYLLGKLARGLGCGNVDFRLRQTDFAADGGRSGTPWLGMPVDELGTLDRVLVVGSFLRKDHPLLANRFRQAAKRSQRIHLVHVAADDPLMPITSQQVVAPGDLPTAVAAITRAVLEAKGMPIDASLAAVEVTPSARAVADSLAAGKSVGLFLGNVAVQHPAAATLHALVQRIADALNARWGFLGEAANSVGGYIAQCVPSEGGLNAARMIAEPRRGYLLLGCEPELDMHDGGRALRAMQAAELVVAMGSFEGRALEYAHAVLPIAPFTETSGSFVNTEGRLQGFHAVVPPLGETRPAWKVLRVLGNLLGLAGFEFATSEEVREEATRASELASRLDNRLEGVTLRLERAGSGGLTRIADVPIYFADPLVRRAPSLQRTRDAQAPKVWASAATLARIGLTGGMRLRVRQGDGEALLEAAVDDRLPADCLRVAAAHGATAHLGEMFGPIEVERA